MFDGGPAAEPDLAGALDAWLVTDLSQRA